MVQMHSTNGKGLYYQVHSLSETGPSRTSNEDNLISFFPVADQSVVFAMVADGMGGHNAGEVASGIACQTAKQFIQSGYTKTKTNKLPGECVQAMQTAIRNAATSNQSYEGMGTTATMLLIEKQYLHIAHVGDSRLYHLRQDGLKQLTVDHTLVNHMLAERKITSTEATDHSMKHVLVQALGIDMEIIPQCDQHVIQPGDRLFICSDGIYDVLQPEELESLLKISSPAFVMECIKAICMQRKASDNFSAIFVTTTHEPPASAGITREQNIFV